jgi:hypothetical protein
VPSHLVLVEQEKVVQQICQKWIKQWTAKVSQERDQLLHQERI